MQDQKLFSIKCFKCKYAKKTILLYLSCPYSASLFLWTFRITVEEDNLELECVPLVLPIMESCKFLLVAVSLFIYNGCNGLSIVSSEPGMSIQVTK